jgi:hypothetical protein
MAINRKYDIAAFATLGTQVLERGSVTLDLGDNKICMAFRIMFYNWRKQEQDLGDPSFLADVVPRIREGKITFTAGSVDPVFRAAMTNAGITVQDEGDSDASPS